MIQNIFKIYFREGITVPSFIIEHFGEGEGHIREQFRKKRSILNKVEKAP